MKKLLTLVLALALLFVFLFLAAQYESWSVPVAVILSLLAASLTYWVVNVRRRWYAEELVQIEHEQRNGQGAAAGVAHELTVEIA